ncbi:MAG: ABC transporter permease [Bacteroidetes bacterium]|nr:ABC transporter permease [Bacteroidota bacterium]MBS1973586.1 ABC transporter permease [Bacteroidota bacterium]
MNFIFAWRYFKAKKSTNAINIIAWVSVLAIIIGTASLILVLSVFNGFEGLVKSLYSSFYTDLKISPKSGKIIMLSHEQLKELSSVHNIRSFSLVVEDKALLQNGEQLSIVNLKGVDSNYTHVIGIEQKIVNGKFAIGNADTPSIVLGAGIENALGVQADRNILPLSAYLFKNTGDFKNTDQSNNTELESSLSNASIFTSGTFLIQQDFDNSYAFTNIGFMKQMLGLRPYEYSGVEIAVKDPKDAERTKVLLQKIFDENYKVETRYEQNKSLYGVMRMEKWVIYAVLTLILIVAAFNIVGALTMLVLEKQKDIYVLKALGANNNYIKKIFLSEGFLLAVIGGACGIVLALIIGWLQVKYKLIPLQGGSFLIDYYPVKFVATDFLLVAATILFVSFIASWFPAYKASVQQIELKS